MSSNSNDHRSVSMNPNNPAYHASAANRAEQLELNDDDGNDPIDNYCLTAPSYGYAQTVEKRATVTRVRLNPAPAEPCPEAILATFVRS